ncbi:MAG: hypothetical protein ACP5H3_04040 [Candidatus Aenigmatarchaeota archaeon]
MGLDWVFQIDEKTLVKLWNEDFATLTKHRLWLFKKPSKLIPYGPSFIGKKEIPEEKIEEANRVLIDVLKDLIKGKKPYRGFFGIDKLVEGNVYDVDFKEVVEHPKMKNLLESIAEI